jgi:hypothetical protein
MADYQVLKPISHATFGATVVSRSEAHLPQLQVIVITKNK